MTKYRIVEISYGDRRLWKIQEKWLFWWLDEEYYYYYKVDVVKEFKRLTNPHYKETIYHYSLDTLEDKP